MKNEKVQKYIAVVVIIISILICLFNFLSIIKDDFFWKSQYTMIMFLIDTILILFLIFFRKRS